MYTRPITNLPASAISKKKDFSCRLIAAIGTYRYEKSKISKKNFQRQRDADGKEEKKEEKEEKRAKARFSDARKIFGNGTAGVAAAAAQSPAVIARCTS